MKYFIEIDPHTNVVFDSLGVEYQPTSENMLIHFSEIIIPLLPKNVQLHNLKLQETNSSVASWYASDQ